jgi:cytochrome c-type biogenesis protein CcmH
VKRREFLSAGAAGWVFLPSRRTDAPQADTSQDTSSARLFDPTWAGRARDRVTDYENDPFIIGIESRLKCTCGCNLDVYTCRTTDFTCGVSPAMHREVVGMVEQGLTAEQVIEAFVAQHGETVLMAPKKEGFNLTAYVLPSVAILAVGSLIAWTLVRRARASASAPAEGPADVPGLSPEDQARLEAELASLER